MSSDERTIYVGGISERVSEEILYELFLQAGPLEKVSIPKDKEGRKRKFAFVTFKHEVSVPYTLQLFDGISLYGRSIQLRNRNGGQEGGSPNMSPGMSPPAVPGPPQHVNPPVYGGPGQFHRSHTWHGNLPNAGQLDTPNDRHYVRQHSGSSSPDSYRQQGQNWNRSGYNRGQPSQTGRYNQQGWFNQGSPNPPPSHRQQSMDSRRQRVLQQQQMSLDGHRQRQSQRHQGYDRPTMWQQQRYGRY